MLHKTSSLADVAREIKSRAANGEVCFSKHAMMRFEQRMKKTGIILSEESVVDALTNEASIVDVNKDEGTDTKYVVMTNVGGLTITCVVVYHWYGFKILTLYPGTSITSAISEEYKRLENVESRRSNRKGKDFYEIKTRTYKKHGSRKPQVDRYVDQLSLISGLRDSATCCRCNDWNATRTA